MKKYSVLLLILVLFSICSISAIAMDINAERDQVTITEEIIYGDKEIAEGLTITSKNYYDYHLHWTTDHTIGDKPETSSQYQFTQSDGLEDPNLPQPFIEFGLDVNQYYDPYLPAEELTGFAKIWKELEDNTAEGEETNVVIDMKDYFDSYPLQISFVVPTTGSYLYAIHLDSQFSSIEQTANHEFMNFFKLPIQEDQQVAFSYAKYPNGSSSSGEEILGSHYFFDLTSTCTKDRFFFTFLQTPYEGSDMIPVDTSLIPGGYGIYTFRYNAANATSTENRIPVIETASLMNLYPLEEGTYVKHLALSSDETQLLMITIEEDGSYLRVLDLATVTETQKLFLGSKEAGSLYQYDDFLAINLGGIGGELAVISQQDSTYKYEFTVPIAPKDLAEHLPNNTESSPEDKYVDFVQTLRFDSMDFDGEHLAAVSKIWDYTYGYGPTCHYHVLVYTKEGLQFLGDYYNGLTPDPSYDYHLNCHPYDIYKSQISWNN